MNRLAPLALVLLLLPLPASAGGPVYKMVSGQWWEGGSPECNRPMEVQYVGAGDAAILRWRETNPNDAWREWPIQEYVADLGKFRVANSDRTIFAQGQIANDTIRGFITFSQRACEFRFTLRRS